MTDKNWLEGLKAGDSVAVRRKYNSGHEVVAVDRLTPTQIVLADGRKYRRKDGRSIGTDSWGSNCLREVTDGIAAAARRRLALELLANIANGRVKVTDSALLAMVEIYRKETP